jgi:ferredoxin
MSRIISDSSHDSSNDLTIAYGNECVSAVSGQRLLDAILEAGIEHRHVCGGFGFCTSCRVEVIGTSDGLSRVSALERERLGQDVGRLRLACQTRVYGPAAIRVPPPQVSRFSPDEGES